MEPRLKAGIWVSAYRRILDQNGIPAFITRRGDADAGTIHVKAVKRDGSARVFGSQYDFEADRMVWAELAQGNEAETEAWLRRQAARDPDLWVVEIETATGETHLEDLSP